MMINQQMVDIFGASIGSQRLSDKHVQGLIDTIGCSYQSVQEHLNENIRSQSGTVRDTLNAMLDSSLDEPLSDSDAEELLEQLVDQLARQVILDSLSEAEEYVQDNF